MSYKLLIMADIHANLTALEAVLSDASVYRPDAVVLMGDIIDYGMRPNEVIRLLRQMPYPVLANLYGNHERLLFDDTIDRLSTIRGREMAVYTRTLLDDESWMYIRHQMNPRSRQEIVVRDKRLLLIHGNQYDASWGKFDLTTVSDECFRDYDYVITAHSHQPHVIPYYFDTDDQSLRNKHKVVFINPGSVGQPRNHNYRAHYALLDINNGSVHLMAVPYDVKAEQRLYPDCLDSFYSERLERGV